MANSDTHQITAAWTPVQANGTDIDNGNFTIFNLLNIKIDFKISNVLPTEPRGDFYMSDAEDSVDVTLLNNENLYAKIAVGTTKVGVRKT